MKKLILLSLISIGLFASCSKTSSPAAIEAYSVSGIHDIIMSSYNSSISYGVNLPITINYNNSTQQKVTVSIVGFPSFIKYGTTYLSQFSNMMLFSGPWVGVPTYSIPLVVYDDYYNSGYVPGTYPIIITLTNESGAKKTFNFNLICMA